MQGAIPPDEYRTPTCLLPARTCTPKERSLSIAVGSKSIFIVHFGHKSRCRTYKIALKRLAEGMPGTFFIEREGICGAGLFLLGNKLIAVSRVCERRPFPIFQVGTEPMMYLIELLLH
jgi:hypothetical protein